MKKIIGLLGIVFLVGLLFVPLVSASYVCPAALTGSYGYTLGYYLSALHPSVTSAKSVIGDAFTANATAYLYNVTIYMYKTGLPTGSITARLYAATGTVGTDAYPTGTPLASSSPIWADTIIGTWAQFTFIFDGTYEMQSSTGYVMVFEVTSSGFNSGNYVWVATHGADASNNGVRYAVGTWLTDAGDDLWFIINGDSEEYVGSTPTPTPEPSTSTSDGGDATLEYWSGVLMPWLAYAVILLIPAFLGLKFLGQMGFIVGLNIGAFLLYLAFPNMIWIMLVFGVMDLMVVFYLRG